MSFQISLVVFGWSEDITHTLAALWADNNKKQFHKVKNNKNILNTYWVNGQYLPCLYGVQDVFFMQICSGFSRAICTMLDAGFCG